MAAPSGFETPLQWIMPSLTVGMASSATIMRQTRSSMLEVIRQDYITTARAKGQKESVIIFHHALRNALIPIITVVVSFGTMLGGAILAESIFSIPGIGKLMVDAINVKNYPWCRAAFCSSHLPFHFVNLFVDILYMRLWIRVLNLSINPRVRAKKRRPQMDVPGTGRDNSEWEQSDLKKKWIILLLKKRVFFIKTWVGLKKNGWRCLDYFFWRF
jgi:peptide/nickel transport system permease protein